MILAVALLSTVFSIVQTETDRIAPLTTAALAGDQERIEVLVAQDGASARRAVAELLRESRNQPDALEAAGSVARTMANVHGDSSALRRLDRFARWDRVQRSRYFRADSLNSVGRDALFSDGPQAAIRAWEGSFDEMRSLNDSAGIAAVLGNLGAGLYVDGRLDSAVGVLEAAATMARSIDDRSVAANAEVLMGAIARSRRDLGEASSRYRNAIDDYRRISDRRGLSAAFNNLGDISAELGDRDGAARSFRDALAINRELGDESGQATNLMNLGTLAFERGDFVEARTSFVEAHLTYERLGEVVNAALASQNLGRLFMTLGDFRAAISQLRAVLAAYERAEMHRDIVSTRVLLSRAYSLTGDLDAARTQLNAAFDVARTSLRDRRVLGEVMLARADLALAFNDFPAAGRDYQNAERVFRQAGDPVREAGAQQGLAILAILADDPDRATRILQDALRTQTSEGARNSAAWSRLMLADAAGLAGHVDRAREAAHGAIDDFGELGDSVSYAYALGQLAEMELQDGLPLMAESLFASGLQLATRLGVPDLQWRLEMGLGRVLHSQNRVEEAVTYFERAVEIVEGTAAGIGVSDFRSSFLADKWEAYWWLALGRRELGLHASGFYASEQMRSRGTLDALSRGRVDLGRAVEDTALTRREQDLRRWIGTLTASLTSGDRRGMREPNVAALSSDVAREALMRAQGDYTRLLTRIDEVTAPAELQVIPSTSDPGEIADELGPHEALIEYLIGETAGIAFVVTSDGVRSVDLGIDRRTVAQLVTFVRETLAGPPGRVPEETWRAPLRRLHQYLFEPIEQSGLLANVSSIVVVPHAELHYVPFEALIATPGGRYLVQDYSVTYAPSASAWHRLRLRPPSSSERVLAMAPSESTLPGSIEEVRGIRSTLGMVVDVRIGDDASERIFRDTAGEYGIVHVASRAILNKPNPLFSFIELAESGGDDGRLEVHEVYGLNLDANLVVLSACQTGLGSGAMADVPPGDDWVGLVRAFLIAGSRSVIATLWAIEDRSTAAFIQRFYEKVAEGYPYDVALTRAKRSMLRSGETPHPFYWSGFVLVGAP